MERKQKEQQQQQQQIHPRKKKKDNNDKRNEDVEVIVLDNDDEHDEQDNVQDDTNVQHPQSTPLTVQESSIQITTTNTITPSNGNDIKNNNTNYDNDADAENDLNDMNDVNDENVPISLTPTHYDYDHHFASSSTTNDTIGNKPRKDARIIDVLTHNLRELEIFGTNERIRNNIQHKQQQKQQKQQQQQQRKDNEEKMEGDIPQLNLHSSFFMEGVRIGWPYPVIMPPQRQMALHLIKAFKNRRHVVIESPTGTG